MQPMNYKKPDAMPNITITSPLDMVKYDLLQQRLDVQIELERILLHMGRKEPYYYILPNLQAKLFIYFYSIEAMFRNSKSKEEVDNLHTLISSGDVIKLREAIRTIELWLYAKGLTKFDTKQVIESSIVERENESEGQ